MKAIWATVPDTEAYLEIRHESERSLVGQKALQQSWKDAPSLKPPRQFHDPEKVLRSSSAASPKDDLRQARLLLQTSSGNYTKLTQPRFGQQAGTTAKFAPTATTPAPPSS